MIRPVATSDSIYTPASCSFRRKPRRCAGPLPAQDVKPDDQKIKPKAEETKPYVCVKPVPTSVDSKPKYEGTKPYPWVNPASYPAQDLYYPAQDICVWGKDEILKAEES